MPQKHINAESLMTAVDGTVQRVHEELMKVNSQGCVCINDTDAHRLNAHGSHLVRSFLTDG